MADMQQILAAIKQKAAMQGQGGGSPVPMPPTRGGAPIPMPKPGGLGPVSEKPQSGSSSPVGPVSPSGPGAGAPVPGLPGGGTPPIPMPGREAPNDEIGGIPKAPDKNVLGGLGSVNMDALDPQTIIELIAKLKGANPNPDMDVEEPDEARESEGGEPSNEQKAEKKAPKAAKKPSGKPAASKKEDSKKTSKDGGKVAKKSDDKKDSKSESKKSDDKKDSKKPPFPKKK